MSKTQSSSTKKNSSAKKTNASNAKKTTATKSSSAKSTSAKSSSKKSETKSEKTLAEVKSVKPEVKSEIKKSPASTKKSASKTSKSKSSKAKISQSELTQVEAKINAEENQKVQTKSEEIQTNAKNLNEKSENDLKNQQNSEKSAKINAEEKNVQAKSAKTGKKVKEFFTKLMKNPLALPICALIVVVILSAIVTKVKYNTNFFRIEINKETGVLYGSIIDILNRSSELVILAVGMTLVAASSRGTDISVGSVMAITGALIIRCLGESPDSYAMPLACAIIIGLLGSIACGAFNGFLVANLNIQPMVATLILYTAGRGIAQLISSRPIISNGEVTGYATGVILYIRKESYRWIGGFLPHCIVPTPIFIAILFVLLICLFLRFTAFSTYVQTVGINPKAGRLVGINSVFVMFMCYVICGLSSGVAGLIASSRIYSSDANNIGLNMELDAILAVALGGNNLGGGKFKISGSIIGAITIQALSTSLYTIGVPATQLPVYKAIVVILIVLFQSPVFKAGLARAKAKRLAKKSIAVQAVQA